MTESPAEGAAYAAHLVLAMHADGRRRVRRAQVELAGRARLHPNTFRGCVRELIALGLVDVITNASGRTPALLELRVDRVHGAVYPVVDRAVDAVYDDLDRAHDAVKTDDSEEALLIDLDLKDQDNDAAPRRRSQKRDPRPFETEAREIVGRVWQARAMPPAQPFVAIVKIVEALLGAGWPGPDVERACTAVPTISSRWVEAWLNESRGTSSGPRARIDDDRDRPTGRVNL